MDCVADFWDRFTAEDLATLMLTHHGDQNYINELVPVEKKRYLDPDRIMSYRWQISQGGWDFRRHRPRMPGQATELPPNVNILVFHGHPKPHEVQDPVIAKYWS